MGEEQLPNGHDVRYRALVQSTVSKPVRHVVQIDAFMGDADEYGQEGDKDNDALVYYSSLELRRTELIRLCIPPNADPKLVKRALRKMIKLVDAALEDHREETLRRMFRRSGYDDAEEEQ